MKGLVLSLFPGIGLLDMAFEEAGFCVVRGPDVLWGGDIRKFHPPAGRFDGVIGGPPCQSLSRFRHLAAATGKKPTFANLIPEFERCVEESAPTWFLMEQVPDAPVAQVLDYGVHSFLLNNRQLGEVQHRCRRWSFGCRGVRKCLKVETVALESPEWTSAILASGGVRPGTEGRRGKRPGREYGYVTKSTLAHATKHQGLPDGFLEHAPFTQVGKHRAIGNGVPLAMGRAIAAAVVQAIESGAAAT